ncbi:MAG: S16 family serine protease, partial [Myxococcaceae bacterium]
LFRKRLYERARDVLERAQRMDPDDAKLAQLLKDLYLEMGDEAAVDRVAGKKDREYFVRQTLATLKAQNVIALLTGALKEAANALQTKDPAAAKRALVAASSDDKASAAFPFLRGELLLWESEFEKAEIAFKAAVERKPDFGQAWNRLGDLHQTRGELKESVPFYERAVNSTPDDPGAWEDLGDIFSTIGEKERAVEAYQKAAKLNPSGKASDKLTSLDRAPKIVNDTPIVGKIHALGWNPSGGAVSPLQAAAIPGSGQLIFSGNVGPVGKEAGQVAFSCIKARAAELGILEQVRNHDLHLHFEDSEFTKEGPSAGLALVLVGISAYTGRPLKGALAASGEISLHGDVRAVGGIHEKMVAAKLFGIKTVLVPRRNLRDVRELPSEVRDAIEFIHVDTVGEALQKILLSK